MPKILDREARLIQAQTKLQASDDAALDEYVKYLNQLDANVTRASVIRDFILEGLVKAFGFAGQQEWSA
jgi:hypothetical protein